MRITAQEEFGLRCLMQLARARSGLHQIVDISREELLTTAYVAKLLRVLRVGGIVQSARGPRGGYRLVRPADETSVGGALAALDDRFDSDAFCRRHRAGGSRRCAHAADCPIRPIWSALDRLAHWLLARLSLSDLLLGERAVQKKVAAVVNRTSID